MTPVHCLFQRIDDFCPLSVPFYSLGGCFLCIFCPLIRSGWMISVHFLYPVCPPFSRGLGPVCTPNSWLRGSCAVGPKTVPGPEFVRCEHRNRGTLENRRCFGVELTETSESGSAICEIVWEMESKDGDRPLYAIAKAWKGLQGELGEGGQAALRLGSFSHGCSLISPLFGCLGVAFKFAEKDYIAKVQDLCGAAKDYATLPAMVDQDIRNDTVRNGGSHTRNLLRVLRGVDMVRVLFEHILVTEGNSLKEPASKAYEQVFARHHGWAIRKAVGAGMFMLPTKAQFLKKLHEEEGPARESIQEFVKSAGPVVQYVNDMFIDKELGTDW